MSLTARKLLVSAVMLVVIVLANARVIAEWLEHLGLVTWAAAAREEYLTGTAIAVIVTMLVLLAGPSVNCSRPWHWIGRCGVCGHLRLRSGCYCSTCGSRT